MSCNLPYFLKLICMYCQMKGIVPFRLFIRIDCAVMFCHISFLFNGAGTPVMIFKNFTFSASATGTTTPYWDILGNTIVTTNYVRLTPDSQSKNGAVWNQLVGYDFGSDGNRPQNSEWIILYIITALQCTKLGTSNPFQSSWKWKRFVWWWTCHLVCQN